MHNPKVFYRISKSITKLNKKSKLVKGFTIQGEDVSLKDGLKTRIIDLYRPPDTPRFKVRIARDQ